MSDSLFSVWRKYDLIHNDTTIQVAESIEDAMGIKSVLRKAWNIGDSENFFYSDYANTDILYNKYILPSLKTLELCHLYGLPAVIKKGKQIVATASLIFDHQNKLVEYGRGAIDPEATGVNFALILDFFREVLKKLPDYSIVGDCIFLIKELSELFISYDDIKPVAFHPTSFVLTKGGISLWKKKLSEEWFSNLVFISPLTGLGRFATTMHTKLSANLKILTPVLTEAQRPFYDYSIQILNLNAGQFQEGIYNVNPNIYRLSNTGTEIITAPNNDFDMHNHLQKSYLNKIDNIIVRVPCDQKHFDINKKLDKIAILSGVYPHGLGYWVASYTISNIPINTFQNNLNFIIENDYTSSIVTDLIKLVYKDIEGKSVAPQF